MTRALMLSRGDEDDDFGALPREFTNATAGAGIDHSDDYIFMTNPPETLPPDTLPSGDHHEHTPPDPLLEGSTIALWICVVVAAVYYVVTEQKRRRRRLRRQREERLEVYSPKKQAFRRLELVKILKATTMTVHQGDLIHKEEETLGYEQGYLDHPQQQSDIEEGIYDLDSLVEVKEKRLVGSLNSDDPEDHHEEGEEEHAEIQHLCSPAAHLGDGSSSSWDTEDMDKRTLRLPLNLPTEVPASCVICMKKFRTQDQITWSPNNPNSAKTQQSKCCPHAFHQQCIVEWLVKLPDCNCPICRNNFCKLPPSSAKGKK